jgi:hypothetical protein
MTAPVYIVHCVDTEGPLWESPEVKFERLNERFGLGHIDPAIDPTDENLEKLRHGEIDLNGKEDAVRDLLNSHSLNFMESWDDVDAMVGRATSNEFRQAMTDTDGNGWVYNWFCLDLVGFKANPRRRALGHHVVFDHYKKLLEHNPRDRDSIHWHFHPVSTYNDAHHCATHYFRSPEIFEILCRKIIERGFFPAAYRAGFQTERPDSHWFLEQWIPYDISNMALDDNSELNDHQDFKNGRSGDWRQAPSDWSVYQPSHDNYQHPGNCRRWIGRALNVLNRIANIDQREVDKAFARAASGEPTLLGIANHDFRDIPHEVTFIRSLLKKAAKKFPGVPFKFAEVTDAFRAATRELESGAPKLELELTYHRAKGGSLPFIEVAEKQGKVFGPQPFLAIETKSQRFIHDNFDFSPCQTKWFYTFDGDTLPIDDVARIGVAANDKYARQSIKTLDLTSA